MKTVRMDEVMKVEVVLNILVAHGRLPKAKAKADQRLQALFCFALECGDVVNHLLVNNISIHAGTK
jgi:hypothetical protein